MKWIFGAAVVAAVIFSAAWTLVLCYGLEQVGN